MNPADLQRQYSAHVLYDGYYRGLIAGPNVPCGLHEFLSLPDNCDWWHQCILISLLCDCVVIGYYYGKLEFLDRSIAELSLIKHKQTYSDYVC